MSQLEAMGNPPPPNTSLQRTRAALPPSPLSAWSLGCGRWRRLFAALFVVGLLNGCAKPSLERRLIELAGPDATNCGRVDEKAWWEANPCLVTAFKSNEPFYVRYERLGIDSDLERAIVRTRDGRFIEMISIAT